MSHRRKRSKGSKTNPVVGAMVINKGGGGGEAKRGRSLEGSQQRSKDMRSSRHLISLTPDERIHKERLAERRWKTNCGKRWNLDTVANVAAERTENYSNIAEIMRKERHES